jgi:N-glycosylase/DNA lyase
VREYDLAATLNSGQAFRWEPSGSAWEGVVGSHWVRLTASADRISAEAAHEVTDWRWLADYLQVDTELGTVLAQFPTDEPMRRAVTSCRGLRLLRQDPWECLASFILSSSKQIVQIRQIIGLLCRRFGEKVDVPPGHGPVYAFPSAECLAQASEADLRACKMGFRAPYLKATAAALAAGDLDLKGLFLREAGQARNELLRLPGVGRKIADCVLLFAYGFQEAFPVDVWVRRALRELYFPKRRVTSKRLERFSRTYFGTYAGYAQQYLFHYMRTQPEYRRRARRAIRSSRPGRGTRSTPRT